MKGYSYPLSIREKCLNLRQKGYSLNEIAQIYQIPKTTVHDWVSHKIVLNCLANARIQGLITRGRIKGNKSLNRSSIKIIPQPIFWNPELVSIVAHFLFDGYPTSRQEGYVYCSRNLAQIKRLNKSVKIIFGLEPRLKMDTNGVIKSGFFSVKFNRFINSKKKELLELFPNVSNEMKKAFLKAFFDDEGGVSFNKNSKKIRGFQHSDKILRLAKQLLSDFDIDSRIDKRKTEITITGKENVVKFQDEINFSPRIYINPKRKNGLWKHKIDKRTILKKLINSYSV